jgi:hypothetical protein
MVVNRGLASSERDRPLRKERFVPNDPEKV